MNLDHGRWKAFGENTVLEVDDRTIWIRNPGRLQARLTAHYQVGNTGLFVRWFARVITNPRR